MFEVSAAISSFVGIVVIVGGLLLFIVHTAFALGVHEDAVRVNYGPKGTLFVGPGMWAFATFVMGPFLAAVYWLIHHSTLRTRP